MSELATRRSERVAALRRGLYSAAACAAALTGLAIALPAGVWIWVCASLAAAVVVVGLLARVLFRSAAVGTAVAIAAAAYALQFSLASEDLWMLLPTPTAIAHAAEAINSASVAAAAQPSFEIVTGSAAPLLVAAVAALAALTQVGAFGRGVPVALGAALLGLLVALNLLDRDSSLLPAFVGAALCFTIVFAARNDVARPRVAALVAGATIAATIGLALVVPSAHVVPPLEDTSGTQTGINPIVALGDNLRNGTPRVALTYRTDSPRDLYLSLTTLDEFDGRQWSASPARADPIDNVLSIEPLVDAEGLSATLVNTAISIGDVRGVWLPVPSAPRSVQGLTGDWVLLPATLDIRTFTENMHGQSYRVASEPVQPSADLLRSSGSNYVTSLERYRRLPYDFPDEVSEAAREITAGNDNPFDQALALQSYFHDGDFTYSEQAPVAGEYDGSGADMLTAFLQARSGYCVHFASAMAAMARVVGIPSRVVVGFTAGERHSDPDSTSSYFVVTTADMHAWPELYFVGVGWVRFEPTVGRGQLPIFPAAEPGAAPTPTASPRALPPAPDPFDAALAPVPDRRQNSVGQTIALLLVGALLICLVPAGLRAMRRMLRRRKAGVLGTAAWVEVLDAARDLGAHFSASTTDREVETRLSSVLEPSAAASLARIRLAAELESFSPGHATPSPHDYGDVLTVVSGLRAAEPRSARFRAWLLPRSLWQRA